MSRAILVAVLACAASGALVTAADVRTLATLAVQGAIVDLADSYSRSSGHQVRLVFDTGPNLARRVADSEAADVLIAPQAVVEQASRDGRVVGATAAVIGRVAVGVAVRKGARVPDVSTLDAFRRALVEADTIVYSRGTSGVYMEKLFADLGVGEAIRSKALRLANGGEAMERIASGGGNDVGFTMVSEVRLFEPKGVVLAGVLPAAVQNYTTYSAVVMTASTDREAAAGFIRFITTPEARRAFAATGWE